MCCQAWRASTQNNRRALQSSTRVSGCITTARRHELCPGAQGGVPGLVETRCRLRYYWLGEIAASPLNGVPIQALLALSWSEHMDGLLNLTIFLGATFASALVAGLSGFAFGLIAASLWLYVISPVQTAALIIAFGLLVQGYAVWKLRHALD